MSITILNMHVATITTTNTTAAAAAAAVAYFILFNLNNLLQAHLDLHFELVNYFLILFSFFFSLSFYLYLYNPLNLSFS